MRLRRSVLSFLLLTGVSLGALNPALAAEGPTSTDTLPTVGTSTDPAPGDADDTLSVPATREEAEQALAEVKELSEPKTKREARSLVTSGATKDYTLALRDLAARMDSLSATQRSSALSDFQRPSWADDLSDPRVGTLCQSNICVHWIKAGTAGYASRTSTQPYAQSVLDTLVHVSQTYVQAGYRKPRADRTLGGSAATDIYLDDVGADGKYGYCTIDLNDSGNPVFAPSHSGAWDFPAFCELDNDFDPQQFPTGNTSLEDLQVTAAHEYFHATQFAYDFLEDRWFMEASATWAEEQVYDSINDNVQYLQRSQLRFPGLSMDTFNGAGGFLHYGDWIYFQYLTQRLPQKAGALPVFMRRIWQLADSVSGPDRYSTQAIATALKEKHLAFNKVFGQYAAANRHPASAYSEGRANHYPTTGPRRSIKLKRSHKSGSASVKVNHLASATVRFVPKGLAKKSTKVRLKVDMADRRSGSVATALVYWKSGTITTRTVKLNRSGNGSVRVPFSSRTVVRVEVVLANANHSYKHCGRGTVYSCQGVPVKNKVMEKVKATIS